MSIRLVALPFSLIGKLFFTEDSRIASVAIDPVMFQTAKAEPTPPGAEQLSKLATFLRDSSGVRLRLRPVTTVADVTSLRRTRSMHDSLRPVPTPPRGARRRSRSIPSSSRCVRRRQRRGPHGGPRARDTTAAARRARWPPTGWPPPAIRWCGPGSPPSASSRWSRAPPWRTRAAGAWSSKSPAEPATMARHGRAPHAPRRVGRAEARRARHHARHEHPQGRPRRRRRRHRHLRRSRTVHLLPREVRGRHGAAAHHR